MYVLGASLVKCVADILMHPVPKERPRVGKAKAVTPEKTKTAEEELRLLYRVKCRTHPDYVGQVRLTVDVHTPNGRGDLDNYVKLVSDALNGVAFKDDRQVVEIHARRFRDEPEGYHIEVDYVGR